MLNKSREKFNIKSTLGQYKSFVDSAFKFRKFKL